MSWYLSAWLAPCKYCLVKKAKLNWMSKVHDKRPCEKCICWKFLCLFGFSWKCDGILFDALAKKWDALASSNNYELIFHSLSTIASSLTWLCLAEYAGQFHVWRGAKRKKSCVHAIRGTLCAVSTLTSAIGINIAALSSPSGWEKC